MLLVNVNTKQFIPSAGSNFIQPVESRDQIIYGTRVEVRFQLYNPDGTVFVLNESDTFCCGGDNNFVHTDDLMFYSGHEMCRIIDAAQGIVGVTIDATSDSFADKATSQNTRMYVQLKRHVAGDTLGDTVLQDIVYAQPAVMTTEGAPASSDPEYMTAAATLALFRTAPDYQFSADGETGWHDEQDIAADRFYRERRNGGEWGPAIELIEGKTGPTGAAAGFGTPTVAVESLPAGSNATASVTASGDNTAKVFSFSFGIPKGTDGQNGADGVSSYTYVAYASDASGAGFSLTPTNALKFRAEIHTTTAIETPDADDFAGATWVKYIGDDGTGTGDMTKSVYDTNDDGIVDHAATADAVGATTAAQVADAVGKVHTHANKTTLDKLAEADGKLTYDGAEIGGGSGTVKSVNGQLPDESGNVTVETGSTVDESRLLPENPVNGDIPCFDATATVGGGNDSSTKLLLQPATSNSQIIDQAAGNAAPVTLENHNVTVDEEGNMVFDGSNAYLKIPANTLPSDFFNGTDEWTLDIVYNVASKGMQCLFGCSSSLRMDFLLDSNGSLQIGGGPNLGTGWPFNEDVHLTFEIYKDGTVWKYTIFRNGSVVTTGTWVNADWRSVAQYVGWEGESDSRKINGKIKALRLTSGALHKGAAFQSDYPWTKPQTVGEWSKLNKSALVQSVNGQTPDSSGAVTLPAATASAAGLMAAADKVKLDSLNITESKARPGYFKLPGGMIVQWGAVLNITADGTTSVTLPIAFPNSAFVATATATGSGLITSAAFDGNSKLNVIVKGYPGSGSFAVYWIAIGY